MLNHWELYHQIIFGIILQLITIVLHRAVSMLLSKTKYGFKSEEYGVLVCFIIVPFASQMVLGMRIVQYLFIIRWNIIYWLLGKDLVNRWIEEDEEVVNIHPIYK